MKIIISHLGILFNYLTTTNNINELCIYIEQNYNISSRSQLLMYNGVIVDNNKTFMYYNMIDKKEREDNNKGSGNDGGEPDNNIEPNIFVFNIQHYSNMNIPYIPSIDIKVLYISYPNENTILSSYNNHILYKSGSVLIRSLPSYKCNFEIHVEIARAHMLALQERRKWAAIIVERLIYQNEALLQLSLNLSILSNNVKENVNTFISICNKFYISKQDSTELFEASLNKLRECELHSSMQTRDRKTLLDCVNEGSLRDWVNKLNETRFQSRLTKFEQYYTDLDSKVNQICNALDNRSVLKLEDIDKSTSDIYNNQLNIWTVLAKDYESIEQFCDLLGGSNTETSRSFKVGETVQAYESMDEHHRDALIPYLNRLDAESLEIITNCLTAESNSRISYFKSLNDIYVINNSLSETKNRLASLEESLERQKENYWTISKIQSLPKFYNRCVAEIVRRSNYKVLIEQLVTNLMHGFKDLKLLEDSERLKFVQFDGSTMLDLVPDLKTFINATDVTISLDNANFQAEYQNLPKIFINDLNSEQASMVVQNSFPIEKIPPHFIELLKLDNNAAYQLQSQISDLNLESTELDEFPSDENIANDNNVRFISDSVNTMKLEMDILKLENDRLRNQNEMLLSSSKEIIPNNDNAKIIDQLKEESLRSQLLELEKFDNAEIDTLNNQVNSLLLEKKLADEKMNEMQIKLQALTEEIEQQKSVNKAFEKRFKDDQSMIRVYKNTIETYSLKEEDYKKEIENLKLSYNSAKDSNDRQVIYLTNEKANIIASSNKEKANLVTSLDTLNGKYDALSAKCNALQAKLASNVNLDRNIELMDSQLLTYSYENTQLNDTIQSLNKEISSKSLSYETEIFNLKNFLINVEDKYNSAFATSKRKIATSQFVVDDLILVIRQGDSYTLFTTELNKWVISDTSLNAINTAHESDYLKLWFERPISNSNSQSLTKPTVIMASIVHIETEPVSNLGIIECTLLNLFE